MLEKRQPIVMLATAALFLGGCAGRQREQVRARDSRPEPAASTRAPLFDAEFDEKDTARVLREHYTKYEAAIPMRDGVKLHTAFYVPKAEGKYPLMLFRTPYDVEPYGVDAYGGIGRFSTLMKSGYVFVQQDVRGRFQSEGTFVNMRPYIPNKQSPRDVDESSDAYDTIEWLVHNAPKNNGRAGVMGVSYAGFYAAMAVIDAHPALLAASPQAPISDWFVGDDMHHNGAFMLAPCFGFFSVFGKFHTGQKKWPDGYDFPTTDGYAFYLRQGTLANADQAIGDPNSFFHEAITHGTYDDFWKSRNTRPHLHDVKPAVMTVGGWYDAEDLWGTLSTYRAIETQKPKRENTIVMGPWRHGGWGGSGESLGPIDFGAKTAVTYKRKMLSRFFDTTLKDGAASPLAEAEMFETGTNEWKSYDAWPPKNARPLAFYLREGGRLERDASTATGDSAADAYVSDPKKPVPYRANPSVALDAEYMVEDQRFAARRPDVLVYDGPTLDRDVVCAGPIDVTLWVTTTGTDADFVVKLVDVFPNDAHDPDPNPTNVKMAGYQELVRGDVFRARFRDGFDRPAALVPGQPTKIHFTMPDVNHAFRTGHRMMVQVQSSWFPLVDRNPQAYVDISSAKEGDFAAQTQRVLRDREHPSHIVVRTLSP